MRVKLAAGQPYWMLLDPLTDKPAYYLSFEQPGPIEIQENTLSQRELEILRAALRYRLLELADGTESQQLSPQEERIDAAYLLETDSSLKAHELLQLNVAKCLEAINALVRDEQLAVLEAMRTLEEQGQNHNGAPRKTILAAIDKAIANCAGLTDVTETEPEEVTIHLDTPSDAP